jgi:hypothetical protein
VAEITGAKLILASVGESVRKLLLRTTLLGMMVEEALVYQGIPATLYSSCGDMYRLVGEADISLALELDRTCGYHSLNPCWTRNGLLQDYHTIMIALLALTRSLS